MGSAKILIPNLQNCCQAKEIESMASVYCTTPDFEPIYDKTAITGYYVAMGTSLNQFKNGPIIGEILKEIILTDKLRIDHDQFPAKLEMKLSKPGSFVDLGR